jgi:hypothetical protein
MSDVLKLRVIKSAVLVLEHRSFNLFYIEILTAIHVLFIVIILLYKLKNWSSL